MAPSRLDYSEAAVKAARSVLLELVRLLGEYRDHIVLVGGWVPEFIHSSAGSHCGSVDIDLALNHRTLTEAGYKTITDLLLSRGYVQGPQPFIFFRNVPVGSETIKVQVDFLAGEYEGTGRSHRTQKMEGIQARKARGCDLAFDDYREETLTGTLPEGGFDSSTVRVAGIVAFITMKAMALADRLKEKDSWDIYFCLRYYPAGLDAVVAAFEPFRRHGLVLEALAKLNEKFASPDHIGPRHVADFDMLVEPDDRAIAQRDAYERVKYLLTKLGVV